MKSAWVAQREIYSLYSRSQARVQYSLLSQLPFFVRFSFKLYSKKHKESIDSDEQPTNTETAIRKQGGVIN